MKLRNKKTGEVTNNIWFSQMADGIVINGNSYRNLDEINKDWEDYKPAEPLVENKKAREILRTWAECCHVQVVHHYLCDGNSCFMFTDEGGNDCCLDFTFRIDNLESNTNYTIAELCGEEEE